MDIFKLRDLFETSLPSGRQTIILKGRALDGEEQIEFVKRNHTDLPTSVRLELAQPEYLLFNNKPIITGAWFLISYRER